MKKAIFFLFVAVILFSCSKEKQPGIVGEWRETAFYSERSSGVFEWGPATRWPLFLTFEQEGKYSTRQEMSGDRGSYKYYPASRELVFTSAFSATNLTKVVSLLDKETMEIDYIHNGVMVRRLRFSRKE